METGKNATEYKAILVHSCLLCIKRITIAANASIIIDTERINNVIPSIRFWGRECLKSLNRNDEVRMEWNVMTDVYANVRERTSVKAKITKNGWSRRVGNRCFDWDLQGQCRLQQRQRWKLGQRRRSNFQMCALAIPLLLYDAQYCFQWRACQQSVLFCWSVWWNGL